MPHQPLNLLRIPDIRLPAKPLVMGIVNVTPDSFSDGGLHQSADLAIAHGLKLVAEGADILDIGGESTRPGAVPVTPDQELARVLPVIRGLVSGGVKIPISIDTRHALVAGEALAAGASVVNDVSAGEADPEMLPLCAKRACVVILMHMQGQPTSMQDKPQYQDVVAEVRAYLMSRVEAATSAGCRQEALWVDPGFGFGKKPEHNFALVRALPQLCELGFPVVLGASRKSSLGSLTGKPVNDREPESLAAGLVGALKGASVLRVHDVGWMKRALAVARVLW